MKTGEGGRPGGSGPHPGRTALVPGRRHDVTNRGDSDEHDGYRPGPGPKAVEAVGVSPAATPPPRFTEI